MCGGCVRSDVLHGGGAWPVGKWSGTSAGRNGGGQVDVLRWGKEWSSRWGVERETGVG